MRDKRTPKDVCGEATGIQVPLKKTGGPLPGIRNEQCGIQDPRQSRIPLHGTKSPLYQRSSRWSTLYYSRRLKWNFDVTNTIPHCNVWSLGLI